MAYEVPPLPYDYKALEPHIDEQTMHLHHDKHHQAYVTQLNAAIEKHPDLAKHSAEDLLRNLNNVPEDVRTILFDPQTAGGLLLSISASACDRFLGAFHDRGGDAMLVGDVIPRTDPLMMIV